MTIEKKKRRKKREVKQFEAPQTEEDKSKVQFKDDFQKTFGDKVEEFGKKFEGKGRIILYSLGGLLVVGIIAALLWSNSKKNANAAATALGEAIQTSSARITDIPLPAGSTEKVFKTKKERAEAAIKAFEGVASKFGGEYAAKAKYFIAVNRLDLDRAAGIKELQAIAAGSGDDAVMAKFALAQAMQEDGKKDDALKLYQEIVAVNDPPISKSTVRFAMGKIYEEQGKKKEAVDAYFEIAKQASEAVDADGKPIPLTSTESEAKDKVKELDPEKAKQIKETESPEAMPPLG
ncbi:MAG: tetratricopeptide repeat protein [Pyrinomonadaceae bacterium]